MIFSWRYLTNSMSCCPFIQCLEGESFTIGSKLLYREKCMNKAEETNKSHCLFTEQRHERQSLAIGLQLRILLVGLFLFAGLFFTLWGPWGQGDRLCSLREVLSDSWAVRKCFAKYNSIVFNHGNYRLESPKNIFDQRRSENEKAL